MLEYDHRGLVTQVSQRFWDRSWTQALSAFWTEAADHDPATPSDDRDTVSSWLALQHLPDPTTIEVSTTYDAAGRPTEEHYAEGMRVRRTYNAAGLPEQLEADRGTGDGWEPVLTDLHYVKGGYTPSTWTYVFEGRCEGEPAP